MRRVSRFSDFLGRLRSLFHRESLVNDLDTELRNHWEMLVEENLRRGMQRKQAEREASIKLGNPTWIVGAGNLWRRIVSGESAHARDRIATGTRRRSEISDCLDLSRGVETHILGPPGGFGWRRGGRHTTASRSRAGGKSRSAIWRESLEPGLVRRGIFVPGDDSAPCELAARPACR